MNERPSWDEIFIEECELHSRRSTCLSRKVGAVAVKEHRVLATGYNGAPPGVEHCRECLRRVLGVPSGERHEICRGLHAEQRHGHHFPRHLPPCLVDLLTSIVNIDLTLHLVVSHQFGRLH